MSETTPLTRAIVVLYRRRQLMLRVFLAVFAAVALFTLFMAPVFRAEAKLIVTMNRSRLEVSPDNEPRFRSQNEVREEDLNSVTSILKGRELVKETLAKLHADAGPEHRGILRTIAGAPFRLVRGAYYFLHGAEGPSPNESQIDSVAGRIAVSPIRRSSLIEVDFEDGDPAYATKFLSTFVESFFAQYASTFDPRQAESFYGQQSGLLLQKLRESEQALKEFRERVGIVALEEQRKSAVDALNAAETGRSNAQVELSTTTRRIESLRAQLGKRQEWTTRSRRTVQNDAMQELKSQLLALEVKRADLLRRYTQGSERVREVDEQVAATRAMIAAEDRAPPEERESGVNPAFETLSLELSREETSAASLEARIHALDAQVVELRRRSIEIDSNGVDLARLEREHQVNLQAHTAYLQQREAARLSNAMNESQIVNVSVASPVTTPVSPVRPQVLVNLMIGLALGACAAAAAAFLRDAFDRSVKSAEDAQRATGLEVLAVVPERHPS